MIALRVITGQTNILVHVESHYMSETAETSTSAGRGPSTEDILPQLSSLEEADQVFVRWDWRRSSGETKHEGLFRSRIKVVDPGPGK